MLSTRETNRLHRWTMWRMSVNEGIISCLHQGEGPRFLTPEYMKCLQFPGSPDSSSLASSDLVDHFPRGVNLRERYGSSHGLSDDAYFIFGLPRVNAYNYIPEVALTGSRSVQGDATKQEMALMSQDDLYPDYTPSDLGATPDSRSIASRNDEEIQRINGFRGQKISPPIPIRRAAPGLYDRNNSHNAREVTAAALNYHASASQSYLPSNQTSTRQGLPPHSSYEKVGFTPVTRGMRDQDCPPLAPPSSAEWTYPPFTESRQRAHAHALGIKLGSEKIPQPAHYEWDERFANGQHFGRSQQTYGR
ncbi:hypothetical protein C0Q70_16298 [Pomacea canaliculata]|uniref:Uncharacterized protein n=1 Tax=Pomacea canaliculata TaxID=400727 RepID=A0A2T7NPF4_POMCA|nr:hypothetical protein C0Q70_16298 [Pomacea canaliculata]